MEPDWIDALQAAGQGFSDGVIERGRAYYHEGRVELTTVEPERFVAYVEGSRVYCVEIEINAAAGKMSSYCPCPAARREPCKHEFATLCAIADVVRDSLGADRTPDWPTRLDDFDAPSSRDPWADVPGATVRAVLVLCPYSTMQYGALAVRAMLRRQLKNGGWSVPKYLPPGRDQPRFDQQSAQWFACAAAGGTPEYVPYGWDGGTPVWDGRMPHLLQGPRTRELLIAAARADCLYVSTADGIEDEPLACDTDGSYRFSMRLECDDESGVRLTGVYARGDRRVPAHEPRILCECGLMVLGDELVEVDYAGGWRWAEPLRRIGTLELPPEAHATLVARLLEDPGAPLEGGLPPAADHTTVPPRPLLNLQPPPHRYYGPEYVPPNADRISGFVSFRYGETEIKPESGASHAVDSATGTTYPRDFDAERALLARLLELGATPGRRSDVVTATLPAVQTHAIVRTLAREGWTVETGALGWVEPDEFSFQVTSGIDWFDLEGGVRFGDEFVGIPRLLESLRKGRETIRLDNGRVGLLPDGLGARFALLPELGRDTDKGLRFHRNQAWLLDALLAEQEASVDTDAEFARVRHGFARFDGIRPRKAGRGFKGKLRPYQEDALGWLRFLGKVGLGGCLADDMGLGKTVMVLAHLLHHRSARKKSERRPALVVAPKSVVWNWIEEARRFAPSLSVLEYAGPASQRDPARIPDYDLVVTTYGVLRRDIDRLKEVSFGYAILDEAQAVKNPASQAWKATRLLNADHRLALTGTPVENHLGDLWAIMEFLNPGLLGPRKTHAAWAKNSRGNDGAFRERITRIMRPILLRRTKEQVLPELPARQETVLFCEMGPKQRRGYDELLAYYRDALLGRIDTEGIDRSRMHVLEALLRLRQAACHPGLLDDECRGQPVAKFDTLLPRLTEVAETGRKALVFSQFTSLLVLLKERLDALEIPYTYLDGKSRRRDKIVRAFQDEAGPPLFLISLKAGGSGLNLTAADHVFLLDPWWNPAVERQAVDRAHRIGQESVVNVYRLVTRDTIEERVLELQAQKRDLADAIVGADTSDGNLLRKITRDDLAALLEG